MSQTMYRGRIDTNSRTDAGDYIITPEPMTLFKGSALVLYDSARSCFRHTPVGLGIGSAVVQTLVV